MNTTLSETAPEKLGTSFGVVSVRHIAGNMSWFVPNSTLTGARESFRSGMMVNVAFNPRAKIMRDFACGSDKVSEADATGDLMLTDGDTEMPADAVKICDLAYDTKRKAFCVKGKMEETFEAADYLLLMDNGSAKVGWKSGNFPVQEYRPKCSEKKVRLGLIFATLVTLTALIIFHFLLK